MLYYKAGLKEGNTRNNYDTIIWLKLGKTLFSSSEDGYQCGVYMWGEASPVFKFSAIYFKHYKTISVILISLVLL